ncbi:MAG TPA: RNA methyltransferase [Candidatus Kapabacteria bacterium]|jgi:TrmH family RNA methyltransferase
MELTPLTQVRASHIRGLLRDSRARRGDSEFVLEGHHLLEAALEKVPKLVLYIAITDHSAERHPEILKRAEELEIPVHALSPKQSRKISDAVQPSGSFAVLRMPRGPRGDPQGDAILVLDGIQDPGNVGTIVRTAAWFGVQTILLGERTADPYAPKVVRSTQGAIFDVGIEIGNDLKRRLPELRDAGYPIIATTVSENAKSLYEFEFPEKALFLFGTEARGIRPELLEMASAEITIPRFAIGESLNVAVSAAIILSEFRRGRK